MAYTDVSNMLSVTQKQLQDILGGTWDATTVLLPYLNMAVIEIINHKPEANPVDLTLTLSAGTVQDIGSTYLTLIEAVCNITGTADIGAAVRMTDRKRLSRRRPGWMTETANVTVKLVMLEDGDPRKFYVYPAQPASPGKLKLLVSQIPAEITSLGSTFPLDKKYIPAAIDYCIYRALIEETTIPNAQAKAGTFLNGFFNKLGIIEKKETPSE